MIFTFAPANRYGDEYLVLPDGRIFGCVKATTRGWVFQTLFNGSWTSPEPGGITKNDAVNAAIAEYIVRRME